MAEFSAPHASSPIATVEQHRRWLDHLGYGVDDEVGASGLSAAVSGDGTSVIFQPGYAFMQNFTYENDSALTKTVAANATGQLLRYRAVLRYNPNATPDGTVRVVILTGSPGGGYPSITRTAGGVWDVKLYDFQRASGQGITGLTDVREYIGLTVIPCTSTTRPSTGVRRGQHIYEVDTGRAYVWTGAAWVEVFDTTDTYGQWASHTPASRDFNPGTSPTRTSRWARQGRVVQYRGLFRLGTGAVIDTRGLQIGVPTTANTTVPTFGHVVATKPDGSRRVGTAVMQSDGLAFAVLTPDGATWKAGVPFAWVDAAEIQWTLTYESTS